MACTIKFKDGTEMPEAEFYAWAMDNIDLKEFAKTGSVVFINKKEQSAQFSAIKKLAYNLQKGFQALFGNKVEIITDTEEIDRILAGDRKNIKMQIDGKNVTVKPMSPEVVNGFYSPIEKTVMSFGKNAQKAKEWLNVVGKSDEAIFTGVRAFLENKDPNAMVSKQEILDYMKENRISVVEVVKGAKQKLSQKAMDDVYNNINERLSRTNQPQEVKDFVEEKLNNWYDNPSDGNYKTLYNVLGEVNMNLDDFIEDAESRMDDTRFSKYQLEGEKENYKEVLVILPKAKYDYKKEVERKFIKDKYDSHIKDGDSHETALKTIKRYAARDKSIEEIDAIIKSKPQKELLYFQSSHFDEPNILVHLRMNTRTDAEGNKVLFLEEVQSDWGQEGKKQGFNKKILPNDIEILDDEPTYYDDEAGGTRNRVTFKVKGYTEIDNGAYYPHEETLQQFKERVAKSYSEYMGIPSAPFVTDTNAWVKLGLKVALKEAVAQGVDRLAWSTGTQQFDRWGTEKIDWVKVPEFSQKRYDELKQKIKEDKASDLEVDEFQSLTKSKKGGWKLNIQEQFKGTAFEGMNIDKKALSESGITITSKEDLKAAIDRTLSREKNEQERQKLTDRIWERMQKEDKGTSLPRKEGMESFYGVPSEGNKGIVDKVAEALVKQLTGQEVKVVETRINYSNSEIAKSKLDDFVSKMKSKYNFPENGRYRILIERNATKEEINTYKELQQDYQNSEKKQTEMGKPSIQNSIEITPELKAQVEEGQPMFMRDPRGKVLGFAYEGKIYIDPRTASPTTPIHEFGHIWNQYMKENHKAFYNRGIKLIKEEGGAYIEKVKKLYPELAEKGREADLYEEALAQAIGDKGALLAKQDQPSFLSWLKEMWTLVKGSMKLSVSAEALSKMTLNDYTNLVAGSMLKGSEIYALAQAETISKPNSNPKAIKQAVKNLIATKEKVTVALNKLMGDLYKAESRGFVNGLKTAEARNRAMKEYQAEARKFLKDRGIPVNLAMERAISKIKDEVSFAKTLTKLVELDDAVIRLEQIDRIKGLVSKLKKLRKNKNKLTSSDKAFINNLELPSPYEVSDLDGYEKVLKGLIGAMDKGQREIGVNPKEQFEDFITQELEYINSYKEMIAEIKKMIQTAQWKDEYAELKENGVFNATDIKSEEDWIKLKEGINSEDAAKAEYFQKKLDELEDKFNEKTKLLSDLKGRTKKLMESNEWMIKAVFKDYEDTSTPLDYDQILNNIDNLSYNQLIRLGNIIDNIVAFEDPSGIGDFASLARLNSKVKSFFDALRGRKLLGIGNTKKANKLSMNQLIAEITYAGDSINKALNFILGDWNSMISKAKISYDKVFDNYDRLKRALAEKNNPEAVFKSTVRIDTFAFINQWFKSDTKEDQDAHVRDRVKAMADQHIKFLKNFTISNPSASEKIKIKKATEGLKALQDFGVIKNLDLSNFSYDLAEGITQESLMGKLNQKELDLYNFMLDSFRGLENFKNAMTINMDKQYDEVENYFPTFPRKDVSSEEQASIEDMKSNFQRMSRSNSRAKGRSRQIANGKYTYNSGLTENFSKGYWEAMLIDMGSNQLLDMSNMLYSKFGLKKLEEAGLASDSDAIKIIRERLNSKAVTDINYGNINTNVDEAISLEAERAFKNGVVGMILKNPKQLLKQGVAPLLTNFIFKPKASNKAIEILRNEEAYYNALHNLLDKSTIQSRLILYELNPIELGVPSEYVQGKAGKVFSALKTTQSAQEVIGDIVFPVLKAFKLAKTKYSSLLASTDAYVSKVNILVGYIDHQMSKGKTIEQIIKDLNENKVDPVSLQNAERWQADMNAESMRSNVAKTLRENAGGYKYFMKSFPLTTHQSFVQGVRKLTSKAISSELTKEERQDLMSTVGKFAVQQILYRATVDVGISLIAMAIERGLTGGDDDEYFLNELLAKSSGQLLFDLVLGSKSIYADIGYAIAMNLAWKAYTKSELEERKAEDINFKSKSLEKNSLTPEPQMGGASGVVAKGLSNISSKAFKAINNEEPWISVIKDLSVNAIPLIASIATGSGTIKQTINAYESIENKRSKISNLIDAKLATELGDFSFSISDDNRTNIIDISRRWDFNEIKSSLFVEPKTNQLCLIPKETYKQMQEEATFELFGVKSSYVSSIMGTSNYKKLSKEKIEKFSEKYGLKYNEKRFFMALYANKALDADAIRTLVNSAVTEIAKKSVESKRSKYTIYKYKIEK